MPIGDAGWERTVGQGAVDGSATVWDGSTLEVTTNTAAGSTGPARLDVTTTITVTPGVRYDLGFVAQTAKGYTSGSCDTVPTQFNLYLGPDTAFLTQQFRSTSQPDHNEITPVAPPEDCSGNGPGTSTFGADGVAGATSTLSASYLATSSGTLTIQMRFFLQAGANGNNDDWRVTPSFTACTETA